jgi:hypothetical protein
MDSPVLESVTFPLISEPWAYAVKEKEKKIKIEVRHCRSFIRFILISFGKLTRHDLLLINHSANNLMAVQK